MTKSPAKEELSGIGGWLLIITILYGFSVLSILFNILDFSLINILDELITIAIFVLILTKKKFAPKIIIILLIILIVIVNMFEIISTPLFLRPELVARISVILVEVVINLAIMIYFIKSNRVKNTFTK